MKRCPKCNRTYADDAFTFCLEDGALLSAPYDPEKPLSTIQSGGPPPTVVLPAEQDQEKLSSEQPREREPSPLNPTIASPVAHAAQQLVTESPGPSTRSRKRSKLIYAVPIVILLLVGSGLGLYAYRRSQCWRVTMECETLTTDYGYHYAVCRLYGDWSGWHRYQVPLADVNWTLSEGRITYSAYGQRHIMIETRQASGRRIDVKATFSDVTSANPSCVWNTSASTSFVAQ